MSLTRKQSGDEGENEVIALIPCPSCGQPLMLLPKHFPLYDVQCTGCLFRSQVKTVRSKPKASVQGAGWDIIDKVLKSGHLMPPLIINFTWLADTANKQEIRFYPFVPKKNLVKYQLSATHKQANYRMFKYIGLDTLPYFVVFSN